MKRLILAAAAAAGLMMAPVKAVELEAQEHHCDNAVWIYTYCGHLSNADCDVPSGSGVCEE